ncbi:MAG: hypothetical protein JXB03_12630 [Spirochaetales bacterium]|nr:hypothetical protein [Spirochaetales bacterium]
MMKKIQHIMLFAAAALLTVSCASTRYYKQADEQFQRGNHVEAADLVLSSLQANHKNQDAMLLLKKVFPLAMDRLSADIDEARSGNDEFKWSTIADTYAKIHQLNDRYSGLPVLYHKKQKREITLQTTYYTTEYAQAKEKAAEEQYRAGMSLSSGDNKEQLRSAIFRFEKALAYVNNYKNSKDMINNLTNAASDIVLLLPEQSYYRMYRHWPLDETVYNDLQADLFQGTKKKKFMKLVDRDNLDLILKQQQLVLTGLTSSDTFMTIGELTNADTLVTYSINAVDYDEPDTVTTKSDRDKVVNLDKNDPEYDNYDNHKKPVTGTVYRFTRSSSVAIRAAYKIVNINNSEIIDSDTSDVRAEFVLEWVELEGDEEVLSSEEKRLLNTYTTEDKSFVELLAEAEKMLVEDLAKKILKNFN